MNLINYSIQHNTFGRGLVTDFNSSYITIEFSDKCRKFAIAPAFKGGFLSFEDETAQNYVLELIRSDEENKAAAERQRLEAERLAEVEAQKIREEKDKAFHEAVESREKAHAEQSQNSMLYVCRHEAAHALFYELFNPGSIFAVVKNGGLNGKTLAWPSEDVNPLALLTIDLAGHAAELLYNPQLTFSRNWLECKVLGCESDYKKARTHLRTFYSQNNTLSALNKYPGSRGIMTQDHQIGRDIKFFLKITQDIILENEDFVLEVADALAKKKNLTHIDFMEIRNKYELKLDNFKILKQHMSLYRRQPALFEKKRAA